METQRVPTCNQIHAKPPKSTSAACLGRASGKTHANVKAVMYLLWFNHIHPPPKTSLFVNCSILKWRVSKTTRKVTALLYQNCLKKSSRSTLDGPQDGCQIDQKSNIFPVRSSSAATSAPTGAWRGQPDPNGSQNPLKLDPEIMKTDNHKIMKIRYNFETTKTILQECPPEFCISLDACEQMLSSAPRCCIPKARWWF